MNDRGPHNSCGKGVCPQVANCEREGECHYTKSPFWQPQDHLKPAPVAPNNDNNSPKSEILIHVNFDIRGVPEGTLLEQVPLSLRIGAAFEAFKNIAPEAAGVLVAWPENGRPEMWGNVPPEYAGAVLRSILDRWDRVVSTSLAGPGDTIQ